MSNFNKLCLITILFASCSLLSAAPSQAKPDIKAFLQDASTRCYKLYNQIAKDVFTSSEEKDFKAAFSKVTTIKKIAEELVEIAQKAREYDLSQIPESDTETRAALHSLRKVGDLSGENFLLQLINLVALKKLSTDKNIEPYMNGANMPEQSDELLAYYPDIQAIYEKSKDAEELKYYWQSWREKNPGWSSRNFWVSMIVKSLEKAAKLVDMDSLELWYSSYDNKNFLQEMEQVMQEIKPLYQQLHAFARQELNKKYGSDVINSNAPIPDHLYQQLLVQAWTNNSILESFYPKSELPLYDDFVKDFDARQLIDEAERFYTSLGLEPLDEQFFKEQLKEQDETDEDCKAAIFDDTPQVYMKYCRDVDYKKFMQMHGYLSRVHYAKQKRNLPAYFFNSYDLEYPLGEAVILSASTPKHLSAVGLAKDFKFTEHALMNRLLRMSIHTLFNIPQYFVHNKVMNDLLAGKIDMDGLNKHYWQLMDTYAGVEPPLDRTEAAIDFPYTFYLDIYENHQTKKFVSEILGYQFYQSFCNKTSQMEPLHNCDFYGNMALGNDLKSFMSLGSSKPWRDVIAKILPDNPKLSGQALLKYYKPVMEWLQKQNEANGNKIGWESSKKKIL